MKQQALHIAVNALRVSCQAAGWLDEAIAAALARLDTFSERLFVLVKLKLSNVESRASIAAFDHGIKASHAEEAAANNAVAALRQALVTAMDDAARTKSDGIKKRLDLIDKYLL